MAKIPHIALFEHDYTDYMQIYFEQSIAVNGNAYTVIFGHHINGGFIAIPNWNICCEASDIPPTSYYNMERLIAAGLDEATAIAIANYVEEAYQEIVKDRAEDKVEKRYAVVVHTPGHEEVVYVTDDPKDADQYATSLRSEYRKKAPDGAEIDCYVKPAPYPQEEKQSSHL